MTTMIPLCSTFSGLSEGPESSELCALFPIFGCAACKQGFAFLLRKSGRKEKKKRESKPSSHQEFKYMASHMLLVQHQRMNKSHKNP